MSVIVSVYERVHLLRCALSSVMRQSHPTFEVVVVDDGSTEDIAQVVTAMKDSRISYYRQQNTGVSAARNAGVAKAVGEYVAFLDSDGEGCANWLELLCSGFDEPNVRAVCCGLDWQLPDMAWKSVMPRNLETVSKPLSAMWMKQTYTSPT